jgi:hypothetical protein
VVFSNGSIPLDRDLLERWFQEHEAARVDRTKILWAVFTLRWWEAARARSRTAATRAPAATAPEAVEAAR